MAESGAVSDGGAPVAAFGGFTIDFEAFEIRSDGVRVPVEPQVFDVIRYLIDRAGRLVTKEELLDNVWGTRFVSESSLTSRIKAARRALGDDGTRQEVIQTVHGRGYRWIARLETADPEAGASSAEDAPELSTVRRTVGVGLPTPLTQFIGRERELAALLDALERHRLVTATGPGGVGKTRLALAAATAAAHQYPDGVAFVDLTAVTEPAMVLDAVAASVGVVEGSPVDRRAAMLAALAHQQRLIVVDNCEHLFAAVRPVVEELLPACPGLTILATSRIRLMLPFEHVFAVPGLALADAGTDAHDATDLFVVRMVGAGETPDDIDAAMATITDICRSLDGMALAIELAAARAPSIGLDRLHDALSAQMSVLGVGHPAGQRHDSLRSAIDWTYRLLTDEERTMMRAIAMFAAPFDVESVAELVDERIPNVLAALGRLVDWSIVERVATEGRFRMLESIRQFASEQAEECGEAADLHAAHYAWIVRRLDALTADIGDEAEWCRRADRLLPDGRAALKWSGAGNPSSDAAALAALLATVVFRRGRPAESQARYEEAARWATSSTDRHRWLRAAAGAASSRHVGEDTLRLLTSAADCAVEAGLSDAAAIDLATAAIYRNRASGIIGDAVDAEGTYDLLRRARELASGADPVAEATIMVAENWAPDASFHERDGAALALGVAGSVDAPLLENIALDLWTVVALDTDDLDATIEAIRRRVAILDALDVDATTGFEFFDAHQMACRMEIARGEFRSARNHADAIARLPFVREEHHLGLGRRMEVDALAGEFDRAFEASELFERDWTLAGRPMASNLAPGCYAIAMAHGLLGDDQRRAEWIEITTGLFNPNKQQLLTEAGWAPVMDALVDLARDRPDRALGRLGDDLDDAHLWSNPNRRAWRLWYEAVWVEAAVLAGPGVDDERFVRAAAMVAPSRFAAAIVERARRFQLGDVAGVRGTATTFETLGAEYQLVRTMQLADRLTTPRS